MRRAAKEEEVTVLATQGRGEASLDAARNGRSRVYLSGAC